MHKPKLTKIFSICFILIFIAIIAFVLIDLWNPLVVLFRDEDNSLLIQSLESYGFWRYVVIAVLHMFQVILSVVPAEPIQLLAGFVCKPLFAIATCLAGVALGNIALYILVNHFDLNPEELIKQKKRDDFSSLKKIQEEDSIRHLTFVILGMYFAPVIPYGIIAYSAIKAKMKFPRYMLVCTLGALPSIVLCVATSEVIKNSPFIFQSYLPTIIVTIVLVLFAFFIIKYRQKIIAHILDRSIRSTVIWTIIAFIIALSLIVTFIQRKIIISLILLASFLVVVACYLLFDRYIANIFTKKKMDFFQKNVKNPNGFIYTILAFFIKLYFFTKFRVKVNKNGIKRFDTPSIILFNHPSKLDFIYTLIPVFPQKVNTVAAYFYFCNFHLGRLLYNLGVFPKYLYQPDINALKNMLKVIKAGGILALAPEGRLSAYGEMESYILSTAKFLKSSKVTVYLAKIDGAYFSNPKWSMTPRRGKVEVNYSVLFSKEALENKSLSEIEKAVQESLYYDEYAWMEKEKVFYKGKHFIEGLEQILYMCPVCKKEYTYDSKDNVMECSNCHTRVTLDANYQLVSDSSIVPSNIAKWYKWQKETERKSIQEKDYILESNVILKFPDPKGLWFKEVGKGKTILSHEGIRYIGTINNEEKNILFAINTLPVILFGVREDFEIYRDNTLYYFVPDNIRSCVKWSVVEEQMYLDYLEKECKNESKANNDNQ